MPTTSFTTIAGNQRAQSAQIARLTTALVEEKAQVLDAMRMESQARIDEGQRLERLIQQRKSCVIRGGRATPAEEEMIRQKQLQQQAMMMPTTTTKADFKHMGGER